MRMSDWSSDVCSSDLVAALAPASAADFVRIEGGTFEMGSEEFYREEGPVRQVTVRPFLISSTEVTNADFAAFVAATGYVTTAERGPDPAEHPRSGERRGGKEWVSTCRSRWAP